jgi:hypothetical protein
MPPAAVYGSGVEALESRRKMSEAHRKRGTLVPGTIVWTAEEDELLKTLPAEEVARRTGRTLKAIYTRRRRLGMPDGRINVGHPQA